MSRTGRMQASPARLIEEIFGIDERDALLWLADISRVGGILSAPTIPPQPVDRRPHARRETLR